MEELENLWLKAWTWAEAHPSVLLYAGIAFVVILIIWLAVRNAAVSNRRKYAPKIEIESFQISPLGHDGFLKVRNWGEPAFLRKISFKKRYDIEIKSAYEGVELTKGRTYNMMLHSTGSNRLAKNFLFNVEYSDARGNLYSQLLDPSGKSKSKAKYIGKAPLPAAI